MQDDQIPGFSTRAIHFGYDPMSADGALTPPLHLTSTFAFETAEQGGARFAGEAAGHIYTRISNPTTDLLEQRMASLEGGEAAVAMARTTRWCLWFRAQERDAGEPRRNRSARCHRGFPSSACN